MPETNAPAVATTAAACPECNAEVAFDRAPRRHEIARCRACAAELEVTSTDPLSLELAPEVEEDWGE
ncbi:MAG: lysine biosynthesis protein LysW [Phycisphaerales bacterium]|nr:MAG: lysine biosynthesis protein LysW [Phycisphaerales bacterium]